jgi:hypothetical protein
MNAVLSWPNQSAATSAKVGDLLTLEVVVDGKVGSPGDRWTLAEKQDWLPSGSFTILADSLHASAGDGNLTKISLDAVVHQAGALQAGPFTLRHEPSGQEIEVPLTNLGNTEQLTVPQEPPNWLLPAMPFGGWNLPLLLILGVLVLTALALGTYRLWARIVRRMRRKRSHKEVALQNLGFLQKFARAKKPLQQEEWKKFSFELAGILRKYSDENFRFDSSDMTDREFLAELRLHSAARNQVDTLAQILATIDEVRYGKKELDSTVVPGLLLDSRRFVETTYVAPTEEAKK